ncbi:hypothetical protein PAE9249_00912 [Paenibacillus sp. CECT 9249]|uniref:ABC transporter substrate-binding protein n=1 Tax=Paenibacillus sp. CECT 9249 TaxID=2845385 RepID=UPI001E349D6B|nr:extracellular solute-binding protein [Paenibacillus sp. CECT 9249]CAH0118425.1 hypothetical protein PAE9249_00912 [Paenibacillus sp. CECT 9249]
MFSRWKLKGLLAVLLVAAVLGGCGTGAKEALPKLDAEAEGTLRVMFWDENYFFQKYGNLFATQFPNIEIEVVSTRSMYSDMDESGVFDYKKAFRKFVDKEQPDVLMMNIESYEELAAEGMLYDLESVIAQDKFDTAGMLPSVVELLREKGGGKLYGLAPTFYSNALYYNVDLFNEHQIDLPRDQMSWQELFDLAKRFPTGGDEKERIYGLQLRSYQSSIFDLINSMGQTEDLAFLSGDGEKLTFDSDNWRRVFDMGVNAIKSGAVYTPKQQDMMGGMTMEEYYSRDLFISGRVGMILGATYYMRELEQASEMSKTIKKFQWDLVTIPVNPADPETSSELSLSDIFSVNANSANQRAAWEFIKYINGEQFAKIQSRSFDGDLLTRTSIMKNTDNRNIEAFYKLKPKSTTNNTWEKMPSNFYGTLTNLFNEEAQQVVDGKKTTEEALSAIQEKGQLELIKAKEEEKKQKEQQEQNPEQTEEVSEGSAQSETVADAP